MVSVGLVGFLRCDVVRCALYLNVNVKVKSALFDLMLIPHRLHLLTHDIIRSFLSFLITNSEQG